MTLSVIVADDSTLGRKQVMRALPADWDAEVRQAKNGEETLAAVRQGADLLFLDLTMPDYTGFDVLQMMGDEGIVCPTFVVSADVQPRAIERAKGLGALTFVEKPVDAEKLQAALAEHGFR
ncbi:response regulator receiver protein [Limimonas halophila]|uniref:Response regulator receiver protein n=1 Tax=Limimonas halophila TaxID=1082479 RepID=A0A1G7KVI2_9PROT|nr:response regulator [Limimonas halophila]SDF41233.1 response regulator receiver protein [Limimonas halophila]